MPTADVKGGGATRRSDGGLKVIGLHRVASGSRPAWYNTAMSGINFDLTTVRSTFLDPQDDFRERSIELEHRRDPLTGRYTRVGHYLPRREPAEVSQAVLDAVIPIFAPPLVGQITPRYPADLAADGRMARGKSVLFPNLNPYDEFSPVVAIGDTPYVAPGELSGGDVADALCLMRDFFAALPEDRRLGMVGWNYLPQSSSSIPHPHLQAVATYRPPERAAEEYQKEHEYRERAGGDYWADLVAAERGGDRWLDARAGFSRLIAFAPRSPVPEALIVADRVPHLQAASDAELEELAHQVVSLAAAYHEVGYSSFNVLVHPTADVTGSRLRVRYVPRAYIVPKLSSADWTWVHIGTEEGLCMYRPEDFAHDLREVLS